MGTLGLGGNDAAWGDATTVGDLGGGDTAGLAVGLAGGRRLLGSWDIDDVELAASSGLGGVVLSRVVRDVVAVNDVLGTISMQREGLCDVETYVVPVALALLQGGALKLEGANPSSGLLGVLGEGKLTLVAVP